ncbi:hypothetical protein HanRHA438_Chr13g0591881 [Helianthus annuus]|nr:hypothetical protein HanRHA438_Chr13g0591881 [Helianthus annuus]
MHCILVSGVEVVDDTHNHQIIQMTVVGRWLNNLNFSFCSRGIRRLLHNHRRLITTVSSPSTIVSYLHQN